MTKSSIRVLRVALGLALASLLVGVAAAEQEEPTELDHMGAYLMLYGGGLFDVSTAQYSDDIDNSWAIEATFGYRIYQSFAAELQVEISPDLMRPSFGPRFKYFFMTHQLQPYLSFGVGVTRTRTDVEKSAWGGLLRFGGGVDYAFDENLSIGITTEYLHGTGTWHGMRLVRIAAGPQFSF